MDWWRIWSGLLSNIYISMGLLKEAVDNESNVSYIDIYKHILEVLISATGGFWDLALVESNDSVHTITDKKYVGKYDFLNRKNQYIHLIIMILIVL